MKIKDVIQEIFNPRPYNPLADAAGVEDPLFRQIRRRQLAEALEATGMTTSDYGPDPIKEAITFIMKKLKGA